MLQPARVRRFVISSALALVLAVPAARAGEWCVDKPHSAVTFTVRHLVSQVPGAFNDFDGTVRFDPADPAGAAADITVQASSIDTGNAKRDEHLRSADFFDVAKFPTLTFKSEKVTAKSKDEYELTGALSMHGVTRTVTVPVKFLGAMDAPKKAGFQAVFTVNRKDYGIVWNKTLDAGGMVLGDDVTVTINFQLNDIAACKPKAPAAAPAPAPAPASAPAK